MGGAEPSQAKPSTARSCWLSQYSKVCDIVSCVLLIDVAALLLDCQAQGSQTFDVVALLKMDNEQVEGAPSCIVQKIHGCL